MKTKELIAKLQKLDPESRVLFVNNLAECGEAFDIHSAYASNVNKTSDAGVWDSGTDEGQTAVNIIANRS